MRRVGEVWDKEVEQQEGIGPGTYASLRELHHA